MSYSSNGNRPKLSEKGLLTPDNCVVARLAAPAGPMFAEHARNAIAMVVAKQYSTVTASVYGSGGRIPASRLKRVFDYVEAHLHNNVHLSDLAKTAAMSPYYFARLFKSSTGVSPYQYVAQRRIARAKELLRNPEITVFEVGVRVGYADAKHFRTLFRRAVGVCPSDFREAATPLRPLSVSTG